MKVLLIDANACDRERVVQMLCQTCQAVECVEVSQPQELDAAMAQAAYDIVLSADRLLWTDGLAILQTVKQRWPHTPVVLLTETGNEAMAAEGMRAGLSDYVPRSALHRLPMAVRDSLEQARRQAELQRAEALLQQSEAKFATIFRTSPNSITLTRNSDRVLLAVNDQFSVMTGYTASEALGTSLLELNLWADLQDRDRLLQALYSRGEVLNQPVMFRMKNGTVLPTLVSARMIDVDGTPCTLAIAQDISALKQAEAERAAEGRFLQVQLEVARLGLSNLQADMLLPQLLAVICRAQNYPVGLLWRLVDNPRALEIVASYGEGTAPFVGYRREVHDPVSLAAEAIRTGQPVFLNEIKTSRRVRNSVTRVLQIQAILALPLVARTGENLGVLSLGDTQNPVRFTARDVEQGLVLAHQIAQIVENGTLFRQIVQLQEQYQVVTETLHDAVFVVDREGRMVFVNGALERLLGYRREELLGQEGLRIYTPEVIPELLARRRAVFSGQSVSPYLQTQLVSKDGRRIPVELSTATMHLAGQPTGRIVAARDLTVRLQLEAALRQSQTLQALGTLAGGVAHDFNNILAVILGYTELTLRTVPEHSVTWKRLQHILTAGERARDVVRQMLAFSRQTVGQRQPLHLHLLVREVLSLLRAALPETIILRQALDADAGTVLADATQMHQVLVNLCTNAEHAMRGTGGVLEIRLDAVECLSEHALPHPDLRPGAYVRLSVRDTGHGMEASIRERIFEPFFTTKEVGEGTGLGLAVVHGIVAEHGGVITVDSTPGQGTTCTIYLPRRADPQASTAPVEEPVPGGHA